MAARQLSCAEQAVAALDICIQHHLAAESIVRLWCSSKALQQLCCALPGSAVLVRSVEAAAAEAAEAADAAAAAADAAAPGAAPAGEERNSVAALRWLLHQPGITAQTVNQCRQQLLAIPCVPLAAAKALVAAGLRMQITGQQLTEAAYSCVEGLEVWVAAFDSAGVPQQEWAADLSLGMRHVCSQYRVPKQVIQALTADSPADLLAVALNLATSACLDANSSLIALHKFRGLLKDIKYKAPHAWPHEAGAAQALLRLFIQLCRRPDLGGAAAAEFRDCLINKLMELCIMPGVKKLSTDAVVELVELVLQIPMLGNKTKHIRAFTGHLLQLLHPPVPSHRLAPVHVKRLLAMLQGPNAAAAASAAYRCSVGVGVSATAMVWLARQPGAAAAAAELGLTATDVPHPAAVALLFGGQHDEGDA